MARKTKHMPIKNAGAAIAGIAKVLESVTATGHRPDQIYDDWLEIVEATLTMMPAHARHMRETGLMAEDTPEVKALWERMRVRYAGHLWVFENFAQALSILLDSSSINGLPTFEDVVGEVFMQWGQPSRWKGQFFTPMPVARAMAEMTATGCESEVHARLRAAIDQSPAAQAMLLAGVALDGQDAFEWFTQRVIPAAIEFYDPVTVLDPCVGSGIMLLAHASTLPAWMTQMGLVLYYGQDIDATCVRMATINLMLYGMNAWGLKCALALTTGELATLPAPYREAYTEAQVAQAAGDAGRVDEISASLRQGSLFGDGGESVLREPAEPYAIWG